MTDNLPVPTGDNLPAPQTELDIPAGERPQMSADATLVLPTDVFAPWMRKIHEYLKRAGAKNGVDYQATVATAGYENGKWLYRVKWHTMTDEGVLYLNLMAQTLRLLPQEQKQIAQEAPSAPGLSQEYIDYKRDQLELPPDPTKPTENGRK